MALTRTPPTFTLGPLYLKGLVASPLFASAVTYLMPIVAIFWGVIDGEVLTPKQYVATVIILSGVYLVNNKVKIN